MKLLDEELLQGSKMLDFGLQALAEEMWVGFCSPSLFQQLHPHINLEPVTLEVLDRVISVDFDQIRIIPADPILRTLDGLIKMNWSWVQETAVWKRILVSVILFLYQVSLRNRQNLWLFLIGFYKQLFRSV